jgi:aminopeptidase
MSLIAYNLSPAFRQRYEAVTALTITDPALGEYRQKALKDAKTSLDITAALDAIHRVQRLYITGELGLVAHPKIIEAILDAKNFPTWKNYTTLNVPQAKKDILAQQLYEGHAPLAPLSLFLGDYTRGIGEGTLQHCIDHKDETDVWIDDPWFARRLMHHTNEDQTIRYGLMMAKRYVGFQRRIVVYAAHPEAPYPDAPAPDAIEKLRRDTFMKQLETQGWINQKFTGCIMPSRKEAELDGIPYNEYVEIFFNMCAIDMSAIAAAHAHLVDVLNAGSKVHITNSDGTDVTFGIRGMTFLSSLIEANIPGTEVYSAPERESANGIIIARGIFATPLDSEKRIRDITIKFENGRIVHYDAAEGREHLAEMIEKDEGSHYLGELAFGTNPALTRHVTNGLLVEKIGGSFHVAIGRAYENQESAIINNGNKSMVHWDITTMLRGRDGMVKIDDTVIMRGGVYLDPALAYLNGSA